MSSARGIALQRALAVYLRPWWPAARPAERGRSEPDVLNTPGVVWENKTPRRFDPFAWAKQAAGYIKDGGTELPITVYWPDGVGQQRPELTLAIVTLPQMMDLLERAGIAPTSAAGLRQQLAGAAAAVDAARAQTRAARSTLAAHPAGTPF